MTFIGLFLLVAVFLLAAAAEDAIPQNASEDSIIEFLDTNEWVQTRKNIEKLIGPFKDPPNSTINVHHSTTLLTYELKDLNASFPHLCDLNSIGRSINQRELWVLTISKNPRVHVPGRPEFKYVANMHGNEVFGREALLHLAYVLLHNYGSNKYITHLVDNTRIHLMPSMNPDGYEYAQEGDTKGTVGRGNANGVDLNRDFPPRSERMLRRPQQETRLVMDWTKSIPFVLSANLHSGSSLVNYPFDDGDNERARRTPDHDLFVTLAYTYAKAHGAMATKGPRCTEDELNVADDPTNGITNGAAWYPVQGGMQDWNYIYAGCFELTVEMTCSKFPHASELRGFWDEHKYPLIHYISMVHRSIRGFVMDEQTGLGIWNATVSIANNTKSVKSYRYGDYWRLVVPGTYEITIKHLNYYPVTETVVVTKDTPYAVLNVTLRPHSYAVSSGQISGASLSSICSASKLIALLLLLAQQLGK